MHMTAAVYDPADVKAELLAAFAGMPIPGADDIIADASDPDPECAELVRAFAGVPWQNVTVATVRRFKDALPLFAPAAFACYLPAYMVACIDAPATVDTALDAVLFNLTPPEPQAGWEWDFFQARTGGYTAQQVAAIRAFLGLMAQIERADWASQGFRAPPERIGRAVDFWAAR
jgi:hypothetical protein